MKPTFASAAYDHKKVTTKREKFLQLMDKLAPWQQLLELIEPHYPKKGNAPINMQTMLRIYFLQQWYNLSDPGVEEALYDMESMRRFAHIELIDDAIDETTILNFRRIIEKHQLSVKILAVSIVWKII